MIALRAIIIARSAINDCWKHLNKVQKRICFAL